MMQSSRRSALKLLGGAALTATAMPVLPAMAQGDLVVPNTYQNFKRGTIHSLHPERRIFNIIWEDLGRVKMRAADLVTNYPQLKVGQIVDTHWYDYLDFLIAKKTPATEAQGKAAMKPAEITVRITLGRGIETATVWTCDFSYDYVKINADYRS